MIEILHQLSSSALRELAVSLCQGPLAGGVTTHDLRQIAGPTMVEKLFDCIGGLQRNGWTPKQIATLAQAILEARENVSDPERLFDLVLSGPDVADIPTRDTAVVMQTLIDQAQEEIILVVYAIYNARNLFERMAQKMAENPKLNVWLYLNIPRPHMDTSSASEIVRRFTLEFMNINWPWTSRPAIYYDPRSLEENTPTRASLHAKCLIVDRRQALVTSANFTEAAQERNIEAGVIVRYRPFVERLAGYFQALRDTSQLKQSGTHL